MNDDELQLIYQNIIQLTKIDDNKVETIHAAQIGFAISMVKIIPILMVV